MNTLHTFGCSYTAFYERSDRKEFDQYKEYNGGKFPKTWPELLSEKLGLNLNNVAIGGSSNYEIFHSFCDNVDSFKKGDVVIIGWSYKERFRLVNNKINDFVRVGPGFIPEKLIDGICSKSIEEILVNRMEQKWVDELISWEKLIKKICDLIGMKLLIWSFDKTIPNHDNFLMVLREQHGATRIFDETNGKIVDYHFATKGHIVQANYFLDVINEKIKYNYKEKKLI